MSYTQAQIIHDEVLPQAFAILPQKPAMSSPAARLALMAIGFQESNFDVRRQLLKKDNVLQEIGPAVSFWQFEEGGGVKGVMNHHSTSDAAFKVCMNRGVEWDRHAIWDAMQRDDVLGACFARLLLWTDAGALPAVGEKAKLWTAYDTRLWRPGKPRPQDWDESYAQARKVCGL